MFEAGKRYVFDYEKYKEDVSTVFPWAKKCVGKEVAVWDPRSGGIGWYVIVPAWCKEIKEG